MWYILHGWVRKVSKDHPPCTFDLMVAKVAQTCIRFQVEHFRIASAIWTRKQPHLPQDVEGRK